MDYEHIIPHVLMLHAQWSSISGWRSYCVGLEGNTTRNVSPFARGELGDKSLTVSTTTTMTWCWMTNRMTLDVTMVDGSEGGSIGRESWNFEKKHQEMKIWTF